MPVDMPRLVEIARRHNLFVLEDCALAFGSRIDGTHAGCSGTPACSPSIRSSTSPRPKAG
jgi:dTDP-4-amino-4,6-dideoxygalactose transaminase